MDHNLIRIIKVAEREGIDTKEICQIYGEERAINREKAYERTMDILRSYKKEKSEVI